MCQIFIEMNIMYTTYVKLRPQCDIANLNTLDTISLQLVNMVIYYNIIVIEEKVIECNCQ